MLHLSPKGNAFKELYSKFSIFWANLFSQNNVLSPLSKPINGTIFRAFTFHNLVSKGIFSRLPRFLLPPSAITWLVIYSQKLQIKENVEQKTDREKEKKPWRKKKLKSFFFGGRCTSRESFPHDRN